MKPHFTIGQLARASGVPTSTVRYYERSRLLQPQDRTLANYRVYGTPALERLRFIRAAQANGFTLEDIRALLDFRDGKTAPCREVQELIEQRLTDLERRIGQLQQVQSVLRSSLQVCRRAERSGRCQVIYNLSVTSSATSSRAARRRRL